MGTSSLCSSSFLGRDTGKVVQFTVILIAAGFVRFVATCATRRVTVGILRDASGKTQGLVEYDYVDYIIRQVETFFEVLLLQQLASRVATDEGNGRHRTVGERVRAACKAAMFASLLVVAIVVLFQASIEFQIFMPPQSVLKNSLNAMQYCDVTSKSYVPYMCVWKHSALRFAALPLRVVALSAAIPCFLGVHRVDLALLLFSIASISRAVLTWFCMSFLELRLLGAGLADLGASFLTILGLWHILNLDSVSSKYYIRNRTIVSICCSCQQSSHSDAEKPSFLRDTAIMLPRAIILVTLEALVTIIFDAEHPGTTWTRNTAFDALQVLERSPFVIANALGLVVIVVGSSYLNHIYMVYNPFDFEGLAERFPWITAVIVFSSAVLSVVMAPFLLGSQLAAATGVGQISGAMVYIATQVTSGVACVMESFLFANTEFAFIARASFYSTLPYAAVLLLGVFEVRQTYMLWLALLASSTTRAYLCARQLYYVTLPRVGQERTTEDEYFGLLHDDNELDDEEGPTEIDALGIGRTRASSGRQPPRKQRRSSKRMRPSRRPSRRNSKQPFKKYNNYAEQELDDDEFQAGFGADSFGDDDEEDFSEESV